MSRPISTFSTFKGRLARWDCGCRFDRGEGDRVIMRWDACPLHAQAEGMREALESIARNTCCPTCQEAARVAARALGKYRCGTCGALNEIVNQCGCDPRNMPTRALLRAAEGKGTP